MTVSTDEAQEMARRLARDEALFAGSSSGANVVAALRVAERLGEGSVVVTVLVDSGSKYLSTEVYRGLGDRTARVVERMRPEGRSTPASTGRFEDRSCVSARRLRQRRRRSRRWAFGS
jgi:hypothetical protein